MPANWKTFSFREFLTPHLRPCILAPDQDADLVGMRLYGEGPFHRELKLATKITKKSHYNIRAGDVIYNKLFAWKGTFGIIPQELDGMFVSDKFPTYELDRGKVAEAFLRWYFRYPPLWEQARSKSTGSAALSKLTLNPPRFLELTLRAPEDLDEQNRIATWLNTISANLNGIRKIKEATEAEIKVLSQVLITESLKTFQPQGKLGAVFRKKPQNGWSAKCDNTEDGTAVLALGAVTGFYYNPAACKKTSEPIDTSADYWLTPGDLLMTRSNTLELVGHAAIYTGDPHPCIYPDLMMRISPDDARVDKKFLWYWLQTTPVRRFIQTKAKGTSPTMKKISQPVVQAIPFPTQVTLDEQQRAVAKLDEKLVVVRNMRAAYSTWQNELDLIIPAVLYEAFKG